MHKNIVGFEDQRHSQMKNNDSITIANTNSEGSA